MLSMSVTVTRPSSPHPIPTIAKLFRYSQPRAPAPTCHAEEHFGRPQSIEYRLAPYRAVVVVAVAARGGLCGIRHQEPSRATTVSYSGHDAAPTSRRRSLQLLRQHRFEGVEVQPLTQRGELASHLHGLLSSDPSCEGGDRGQLRAAESSDAAAHVLVK
eukprot:Polyplicarium_translucidae@DN3386_c1_g1_i4.p1